MAAFESVKKIKHNTVWCIFQPHTYTRTKALFDDFAKVLSKVDRVIVADIYAAREKDTGLVSSKDLADKIPGSKYISSFEEIADYIKDKKAIKITYKPFDRKAMEIIFHPHLLYTYNGRFFAFGVSVREGKEPLRKFCIALDRIKGDMKGAGSACTYIPPFSDEYAYLANIVGVRLEECEKLCTIRMRALDNYTFGRLNTKPLHDSQKVILYPDWKTGREYGEFEITVIPNVELIGQILSYGSTLEIISPDSFRKRVVDELSKLYLRYMNMPL